jgi:hypothetical protein
MHGAMIFDEIGSRWKFQTSDGMSRSKLIENLQNLMGLEKRVQCGRELLRRKEQLSTEIAKGPDEVCLSCGKKIRGHYRQCRIGIIVPRRREHHRANGDEEWFPGIGSRRSFRGLKSIATKDRQQRPHPDLHDGQSEAKARSVSPEPRLFASLFPIRTKQLPRGVIEMLTTIPAHLE